MGRHKIKKFDSGPLRAWAKQIHETEDKIKEILTKPMTGRTQFHLARWNRMNSQQKKLFVFRAMELGYISYNVK